jgi:hypothetical protein
MEKKIVLNVNSTNIYTLGVIQTLVIVEKSNVNFFIIWNEKNTIVYSLCFS